MRSAGIAGIEAIFPLWCSDKPLISLWWMMAHLDDRQVKQLSVMMWTAPAPACGSIESCAKTVVVEQLSEGAPSTGKSINAQWPIWHASTGSILLGSSWPRPSGQNRYGQDHGRDNKIWCRADLAAQAPAYGRQNPIFGSKERDSRHGLISPLLYSGRRAVLLAVKMGIAGLRRHVGRMKLW